MKVAIEDVLRALEERARINAIDLESIEWTLAGEVVEIDKTIVSDFALTGLNNIDFISTGCWHKELLD